MSIISHISTFLTHTANKPVSECQSALRSLRNISIHGFSTSQSRSLWYALFIYKYKTDHPKELWSSARELILTLLRNQDISAIAELYLTQFSEWKERDFQSLLNDMAAFYSQVLDIKEAIERTGEPETIQQWQESYHGLITKVRESAKKINGLEQLDALVIEIQLVKKKYVLDIMRQAYWDMLEEELEKGNTIVLICQLQELQDALVSIHDISITDSIQQINDNKWTHDQAWELYTACISFLCHWDSESHKKIYKESIETMNEKRNVSLSKWTRMLMEKSTVLTMDLSIRKALWKLILHHSL